MKKLSERYNNARFRTKLLLIFGVTSLFPLLVILVISSRLNTRNMTDKVDEEEYVFPKERIIGLVHPEELSEEELAVWKEQLADYEIEQPIEQRSGR